MLLRRTSCISTSLSVSKTFTEVSKPKQSRATFSLSVIAIESSGPCVSPTCYVPRCLISNAAERGGRGVCILQRAIFSR